MAPATPESKSNPTSRLCSNFKHALVEGEAFLAFMSSLTIDDLHAFWTRRMCAPRFRNPYLTRS